MCVMIYTFATSVYETAMQFLTLFLGGGGGGGGEV